MSLFVRPTLMWLFILTGRDGTGRATAAVLSFRERNAVGFDTNACRCIMPCSL